MHVFHTLASSMKGKKLYMFMVIVQFLFAGMAMLSKAAFNGGMSTFVFVFYRQAIATVLMAPFAMIAYAREAAPPLLPKLLIKMFILALFGLTINLNVHSLAIKYTSATVASATTNSIPVFTFILAVLFRIEILKLKSLSGIAKVVGVTLCLAGVLFIAFFKGPNLKSPNRHQPILNRSSNNNHHASNSNETWIVGSFLMVFVAVAWSVWIVMQGPILREYPSKLLFMVLTSFFSTFQSFLAAITVERRMSMWKPKWDDGLLAVAYNGVFVAGAALYLQAWCNEQKGPVFVAMFTPLTLVITIACSSFLLGEVIDLGSVLGGALMVGGLYSVLWGKSREWKENSSNVEAGQQSSNS